MAIRFHELHESVQADLLRWEANGRNPGAGYALDLLKRLHAESEDDEFWTAIEHVSMIAADHLARLTAPYELKHRVQAARTTPSHPAFRALAWVMGQIGEWRKEWISGPYQTVRADGTLEVNGVAVGARVLIEPDCAMGHNLDVAEASGPKGTRLGRFWANSPRDSCDAYAVADGLHFYKDGELIANFDHITIKQLRHDSFTSNLPEYRKLYQRLRELKLRYPDAIYHVSPYPSELGGGG